jgi:hypothetical protein
VGEAVAPPTNPPNDVGRYDEQVAKMTAASEANTKAVEALTSQMAEKDKVIDELKAALNEVKQASFKSESDKAIDLLIAQGKLLPAEAKDFRAMAVEDAAAFSKVLPILQKRDQHVAFKVEEYIDSREIEGIGGDLESELVKRSKELSASAKISLGDAMKRVSKEMGPALAQFRRENTPRVNSPDVTE